MGFFPNNFWVAIYRRSESISGMNQFKYLLPFSILFLGMIACKDKADLPEQIQGTRYAAFNQWIYAEPNSKKKEDQVALIYTFEEVTALESKEVEITEGNTKKKVEFLKLETVDKKIGYAPSSGFAEAVVFITADGLDAFLKPTLTAGTKGKISRGSYCLVKETIGEFSRVDCRASVLEDGKSKLEEYWNVWISLSPEFMSRDPLLGETVKLLRQASTDIISLKSASEEEGQKLRKSIGETLRKVEERADILSDLAGSLRIFHGIHE